MKKKLFPVYADLLQCLVAENLEKKALIVVPNEINKKICFEHKQQLDILSPVEILTMSEVKNFVFCIHDAVLKEDKRTIVLYASLDEETKKETKAKDYFQFVRVASNFFSFWDELNEECISSQELENKMVTEDFLTWQVHEIVLLKKMRDQYKKYLEALSYTDTIFTHNYQDIQAQFFNQFEQICIANQFYLTKLEEKMFPEKTIHYVQKLEDKSISKYANKGCEINIYIANDEISMANEAARNMSEQDEIIDFDFPSKSYSNLIPQIQNEKKKSMTSSSIYIFFSALYDLVQSIDGAIEFSIPDLLHFIENKAVQMWLGDQDYDGIQQALFQLLDWDYLYISTHILEKYFPTKYTILHCFIKLLTEKIQPFHFVENFDDFFILFKEGCFSQVQNMQTELERDSTNLYEKFCETLGDFKLINDLKLVKKWDDFFPKKRKKFARFLQLMRLFLEYCKAKNIQWNIASKKSLITSQLADTRNRFFKNIVILNCIEGVFPPAPKTPYLLTERQRKVLGLKTYDDVRERLHYYFARLFTNAEKIQLYGIQNTEQNIEKSAFIEEVMLDLLSQTTVHQVVTLKPKDLLQQYHKDVVKKNEINADFFCFKNTMLLEQIFSLSYYDWRTIKINPFLYIINKKLKEQKIPLTKELSPKFIGTLVHQIMEDIWERLQFTFVGKKVKMDFRNITNDYIGKSIKYTMNNKIYGTQIPKNHAAIFTDKFLIPILIKSIRKFFNYLDEKLQLSNKEIEVYVELSKQDSKSGFTLENNCKVFWKGRSDLILTHNDEEYIIDYKTGGGSIEQLMIYELIYAYLSNGKRDEQCRSILYNLKKNEINEFKDKKNKRKETITKKMQLNDFIDDVKEELEQIAVNGFYNEFKKRENTTITRRDLMV